MSRPNFNPEGVILGKGFVYGLAAANFTMFLSLVSGAPLTDSGIFIVKVSSLGVISCLASAFLIEYVLLFGRMTKRIYRITRFLDSAGLAATYFSMESLIENVDSRFAYIFSMASLLCLLIVWLGILSFKSSQKGDKITDNKEGD